MKNKEGKNIERTGGNTSKINVVTESPLMRRLLDIAISRASQGRSNDPLSASEVASLRDIPGVIETPRKKNDIA